VVNDANVQNVTLRFYTRPVCSSLQATNFDKKCSFMAVTFGSLGSLSVTHGFVILSRKLIKRIFYIYLLVFVLFLIGSCKCCLSLSVQ